MRTQNRFKLKPLSLVVMTAMAMLAAPRFALAGDGWADNTDKSGAPFKQPTFYANSPMGVVAGHGPAGSPAAEGLTRDTGAALRKFVDALPLVDGYVTNTNLLAANRSALGRHIPTAIKEDLTSTTGKALLTSTPAAHSISYPDADYYEIAVVEYREQLHSDLPALAKAPNANPLLGPIVTGGTQLRGYVQIWTPNLPATTPKSQLFYMNGNPILDNKGSPVYAVGDGPHYLGPIISTTSHVPVRLRFDNYLPTGHYDPITKTRGGDSFIPTDYTMPGCGLGPLGAVDPAVPQPFERYTQNRTNIHMHGGDTPWISDGEPHSWITPAGENTPYPYGATTQNVPDMADPGPGAQTYFYPNNQSARMMWYHDHSYGSTRLDVYAGIVSAFLIHDATEAAMKAPATATTPAGALAGMDEIPLIFEDKTFVPKDVMIEDSKWNTDTWGKYGDLWFPHVYEANQNPNSIDGTNPAGRWDYGPWFWPVFPAPLALPTGEYGNVSSTQEQYADTPLLNGIAYPNLNVEPKPYRFRLLNASLQRYLNLGFYVAEPLTVAVNNPGSNYSAATTVTLSADSAGNVPTATLLITPIGAPTVSMVSGGSGYSSNPTVVFAGGGALIQATGHAVVVAGVIQGVVVDTAGSGYTTAPTVTFSDGSGTGAAATAEPTPGGQIGAITLNPPPAGVTYNYATAPTVTLSDPTGNGSGASFATSINTEVPMVPAVKPASGYAYSDNTYDGRPGGVPNPAAIGPNILLIGNEGGFLAQPDVIKSTPISYDQNRLSVTLLNVLDHGLYVGPAERADLVVDFSQYAGKTLILYNDCPAPNPGFDTRVDYYTGDNDQTSAGGADTTLPGYGPNTRTLMRVRVGATGFTGAAPSPAYDPAGNGGPLATAIPAAFAASQDVPIVPQSWQNRAYGTNYTDNTAHIYAGTFQQPTYTFNMGGVAQTLTGFQIDSAGEGYTIPPAVVFTGGLDPANPAAKAAQAHAVLDRAGQRLVGITIDNPGVGYISAPTVTLVGGDGVGASATVLTSATQTVAVQNKGIQELFDNDYGRMNATFSAELPFTSVLSQTTVPLGYADPPTEQIADQETQFWKITHNGVDAHVVHFHLFNVQVINRVGWDGHIKPLEPSEFGWKETVKMMPLEDIYVAVKPKSPLAPFGVPQSIRALDPTQPLGVTSGFTQVNPLTGAATTITNELYNFNWEYVWHCHILGHEENDFMRPMIFDFGTLAPSAVAGVSYNPATQVVSWIDPTPVGVASTYGNKQNEQGFLVQRSETGAFPTLSETTPQSAAQASINPAGANTYVVGANVTSWTDPIPSTANTSYRVLGFNSAGYSPTALVLVPGTTNQVVTCGATLLGICVQSNVTVVSGPTVAGASTGFTGVPNAPTNVHGKVGVFNYGNGSYPITVTWNATAIPANGFVVTRTGGTDFLGNIAADVTFAVPASSANTSGALPAFSLLDPNGMEISGFKYTVQADNGTPAAPLLSPGSFTTVLTGYAPPLAIEQVKAKVTPSGNAVVVNWVAPPLTSPDANITASSHITGYNVVRMNNGVPATFSVQQVINPLSATATTPPPTTYTDIEPLPGVSTYTVYGVNGNVTGTAVGTTSTATVTLAATTAPGMTGASATAISPTSIVINWSQAPAGSNPTGYRVIRFNGSNSTTLGTPAGLATSFVDTGLVQNTLYRYVVQWLGGAAQGQPLATNLVTTPYAPATPVGSLQALANAAATANTLTWTVGGPSTSYIVSRCLVTPVNANCTTGTGVFTQLAGNLTGLTYTDSNLSSGAYVYQVQAMNGPVNVSTGVRASVSDVMVPLAPTNLANTISAGAIALRWTASTGPAPTGYVVQRSADAGVTWTTLSTVSAPTVTYTDTTPVVGTTYQYRVYGQISVNGVVNNSLNPSSTTTASFLLQGGAALGAVTLSTTSPNSYANSTRPTTTATVAFTPTVNAGAPAVVGYNVWAYVDGAATPTLLNTTPFGVNAGSPLTVALALGSTYRLYVTELNAVGESLAPAALGLTAVQNGQPAPVISSAARTGTTGAAAGQETLVVSFNQLVSAINGSSAAPTYTVQASTSASFRTGANTVSGTAVASGGSQPSSSTLTTVPRGSTAAAAPANTTIYVRVNTTVNGVTLYGAATLLSTTTNPALQ